MRPEQFLNQVLQQFQQLAPGAEAMSDEVKKQLKSSVTAAFERMDLVSREEFDAQKAVLLRTRERLEALEKQVAALEANSD